MSGSGAVSGLFTNTSQGRALRARRPTVTLGRVRDVQVPEQFDLARLARAAKGADVLPNPADSPGCSPILRELLQQSGLAHGIDCELAHDSELVGHQGGNALDVTGSKAELNAVIDLCVRLAPLFALVAYATTDRVIYDGRLTFAPADSDLAEFARRCTGHVHIASTARRLALALPSGKATPDGPPPSLAMLPAEQRANGGVGTHVYLPPVGASVASSPERP